MQGFTFWFGNRDYFIESNRKNVTDKVAEIALSAVGILCTRDRVENIKQRIRPARLEIKTCTIGDYYEISGEDFGGRGSFVDDGMTVVIHM